MAEHGGMHDVVLTNAAERQRVLAIEECRVVIAGIQVPPEH